MRLLAVLCAVALVPLGPAARAADGSVAALRADRAASQAAGPGSPAVRAAENAEVPGDLRPENRALPQLSIPLKRKASKGAASAAGGSKGIDDDAARCLAKNTKRERAECQSAGDRNIPAAPRQ